MTQIRTGSALAMLASLVLGAAAMTAPAAAAPFVQKGGLAAPAAAPTLVQFFGWDDDDYDRPRYRRGRDYYDDRRGYYDDRRGPRYYRQDPRAQREYLRDQREAQKRAIRAQREQQKRAVRRGIVPNGGGGLPSGGRNSFD